jgi:hypothetical protein
MSTAYTSYGQENDYSDLFDFQIFSDDNNDGDDSIELGQEEVEKLIAEFKAIMEIPENERTTEQWNRAIEIIFLVYYGSDLKSLFTELQLELETQQELNKQLSDLYNEIDSIYDAEVEVLNNIKHIQNQLSDIYNSFSFLDLSRSFYPYLSVGVTSNIGFNAGAGLILPITDRFIIGAGLVWHYDTDITRYFSFNFMFGWGF